MLFSFLNGVYFITRSEARKTPGVLRFVSYVSKTHTPFNCERGSFLICCGMENFADPARRVCLLILLVYRNYLLHQLSQDSL